MTHASKPYARVAWRAGLFQCLATVGLTACGGGSGADGSGVALNASPASVDTANSLLLNGSIQSAPSAPSAYDVVILEADPAIATFGSLNATGQVAFTSLRPDGPHALLYNGHTIQDLGPGYTAALNDAAQVAGYTATSPAHALRWTPAGHAAPAVIDFGAPAGSSSTVQAINAAGQVTGATDQNGPVASGQFSSHPFPWTEGVGLFDLSTLPLPGFIPVSASHVNALGQVGGSAFSTSGNPLRVCRDMLFYGRQGVSFANSAHWGETPAVPRP